MAALGGMRNPSGERHWGGRGAAAGDAAAWDDNITTAVRAAVLRTLLLKPKTPHKSVHTTQGRGLSSQAGGDYTEDKDSHLLSKWLQQGALLGFKQAIETTGTFPEVTGPQWHDEHLKELARSSEGWSNYSSAVEEATDLQDMISDYVSRGFCHLVDS